MHRYQNVFEAIVREGHAESFVPVETDEFEPQIWPQVLGRLNFFADGSKLGVPMWHDADRSDYDGLVGTIRPRAARRVTGRTMHVG